MAKQFQVDTAGTLLTSLISFWPLLADANDAYGSNHLTNNGSVTFHSSDGASFNGSSQYLSKSSPSGLPTGSGARSISFKMKTPATLPSSTFPCPFGYGNASTDQAMTFDWDTGRFAIDIYNHAGVASPSWSTNTWYTVAVVYSGSGTSWSFYQNNGSVLTIDPGFTPNTVATALEVARRVVTGGQYFAGNLRDIGFWSKALSSQELTDLHNAGGFNTLIDVVAPVPRPLVLNQAINRSNSY